MNSWVSFALVLGIVLTSAPVLAQTQSDLNVEAERKFKKSEKEMSRLYKQLLSKFKGKPSISKKIRLSESQWIDYRDSYVTSVFPHDDHSEYGSVFPMCWSNAMESATLERCTDLRAMLKGVKPQIKGNASKEASSNRAHLDKVYNDVLKRNKKDDSFIECMEDSQHQWREYRDAQTDVLTLLSGKADSNTKLWYQSQLDGKRANELNQWLVGIEEGDVCAGSIPIKKK